MDLELVLYD